MREICPSKLVIRFRVRSQEGGAARQQSTQTPKKREESFIEPVHVHFAKWLSNAKRYSSLAAMSAAA